MIVLDPLQRAQQASETNQIPSAPARTPDNRRFNSSMDAGIDGPAVAERTTIINGPMDPPQIYTNSYPQYDPNISYHGYDLSRDVSEYRFGDDSSHLNVNGNPPAPTPRKIRSNQVSTADLAETKHGRGQWSGRLDFFFSSLGYAVGLGAVWRFPYLCYRNGGGVFLIPYFIFLFLLGIPLFFLEVNLGQFTSQGPVQCWRMAPIFKGLGISMSVMSFFLTIYYAMLVGYSILYFVLSFRSKLDWSVCGSWSTPNCTADFTSFIMPCNYENTYKDPNGRCYTWTNQGLQQIGWWDIESRLKFRKPVLPSDDYFYKQILNKSEGMGVITTMEWPLVLSLLGAWVLVFICLCRGIKQSGKVSSFNQ